MVGIQDINIPEACFYCRFRYETRDDCGELSGDHYCIFDRHTRLSSKDLWDKRSSKCTLIEIEPKKGHWIVANGGSYLGKRNACCSSCKDFYTNDWRYMNYCPNCGADMREVEE